MIVTRTTELPCPPARVWEEAQATRLVHYVSAPWIAFSPLDPPVLPERWSPGPYLVSMRLLGVLPLGRQTIDLRLEQSSQTPDGITYAIRDAGVGELAKGWDHLITITGPALGPTRLTDRVEVHAGVWTPFVALFAHLFYGHRQRRWRRLVAAGFDYLR